MKICTKCLQSLQLDDFYLSRGKLMARCKRCHIGATKSWALRNPEKSAAINNRWNANNRPKRNLNASKYRMRVRCEAISHYSSGANSCSCCGESHFEFLCIDHTNGGGNKHREQSNITSGHHMIAWLRRKGYPPGFRVLCHNCNSSIGYWGYCPHQTDGRTVYEWTHQNVAIAYKGGKVQSLLPDYSKN